LGDRKEGHPACKIPTTAILPKGSVLDSGTDGGRRAMVQLANPVSTGNGC